MCRRVAGAHDALVVEQARDLVDAVHFRRHRHHDERAAAAFDHLSRAVERRRDDPIAAVDAPELRVEERPFEVHAEAARAVLGPGFLELVRRLGDLGAGVDHRFPGRGHDRGDKAGRAHPCVGARRDVDRIPLIAVEQRVLGAVGVDVDQSGGDDRIGRQRYVAWPLAEQDARNATAINRDSPVHRGPIADRKLCGTDDIRFGHGRLTSRTGEHRP